jgi:hypothetical protein
MGSLLLMRRSLINAVLSRRLIYCRFDRVAELMGVPSAPFTDTYSADVRKMKVLFLNYVKALQTKQSYPELPFGVGNGRKRPQFVLETTQDGFPIIPVPMGSENWRKRDWEDLFTLYMCQHYRKVPHVYCIHARLNIRQD